MVVQNLCVQIIISVATFDANHSVTGSKQSVATWIQKLSDSVVKRVSRAGHRQSMCLAKRSAYRSV